MSSRSLFFVVPGALDQRTGGYLYDAHMVDGLRALGWTVEVRNLDGSFPGPDDAARAAVDHALAAMPDGATVVVDGLAMGGHPEAVRTHGGRLRLICLLHHPLADETGLTEDEQSVFVELETAALAACTGVIVTSHFTAGQLAPYGVPPERVRAVLPGTDPADPAEGPGPGQPPKLLCVGTLTPRKGHDVLVSALEQITDLEWTCVFAGSPDRDPDCAQTLLRQLEDAGLTDRIEMTGELDREPLDRLYRSASIFVLASHYEGYGMAHSEALARGLPIVSTTGGAIPFTVPEDAGILVPPGDVDELASVLRSLLGDDPARRDALAAAALRRAAELPTWESAARAFAAAVEELLR